MSVDPKCSSGFVTTYIALGSNLGDRRATLQSAIDDLRHTRGVEVKAVSRFIETAPVGMADQGSFLNAAVELRSTLSVRDMLELCLNIEKAHGRNRSTTQRWGPRTLDLDLLLYGDQIIDEPGLRVPHPHMADRLFVLVPLAEIAPAVVHPVLGLSIQSLLARLRKRTSGEYTPAESCSLD